MRELIIDEILSSKWYQDLEDNGDLDFTLDALSNKSLLEAFKKSLSY